MNYKILLLIISFVFLLTNNAIAKKERIIRASTTSTYDSGLLKYLNEEYNLKSETKVHVISLGTGQAIKLAESGNADILIVHHTLTEIQFMKEGYGIIRHNLMYNDYILVGPNNDVEICNSIKKFLLNIIKNKLTFISRGDDSGTHKKEIELWNLLKENNKKSKSWYLESGQGMGKTLLIANNKKAYTLSDRSTWRTFKKKNNLKIICEGKPPLINQYGIILVKNSINTKEAKKYIEWIISDKGKKLINDYKIDKQQLFFFNHH